MTTQHSDSRTQPSRKISAQWRVVDIVVASVIAVAVGVIFWVWSAGYAAVSAATLVFPPLAGLYTGGWLIAAVLGGLIIRKPGAALFCEVVAAAVSAFLGTSFGPLVLVSGLIQGVGAELVFLLFFYRKFNLWVSLLAGLGAGVALSVSENIMYNNQWAVEWQLAYVLFASISGIIIAGLLPWIAVRALARTGALSGLASRKAAIEPVL